MKTSEKFKDKDYYTIRLNFADTYKMIKFKQTTSIRLEQFNKLIFANLDRAGNDFIPEEAKETKTFHKEQLL